MNMTNLQSKLQGKWMISTAGFRSLYNSIGQLSEINYGGLKGLIYGNSIVTKALGTNTNNDIPSVETGDIALLNICGIMVKGAGEDEEEMLGLVNIDRISQSLDVLAADPSVSCIIINFSSPGGETTGIHELGNKIRNIDKTIKPVYAWTETQCASAAYWLASQCRAIGMTLSASIGNVGVYLLLPDESVKLENEGIKINSIYSGKFKLMGHRHMSLTDEERAILQADVTKQQQAFKDVIKANRPEVKEESLEGLSYEGSQAFELGLVDAVTENVVEFINSL